MSNIESCTPSDKAWQQLFYTRRIFKESRYLWSKVISSLKKINSINLRTFSTVHTNSQVGVDKYTRLPHEVFLLIRWIFTKGNKVLREDHEPSIKFNNFLPAKHVFKMLSYRNIGYASAGGYEDEARHSFSSQILSFNFWQRRRKPVRWMLLLSSIAVNSPSS